MAIKNRTAAAGDAATTWVATYGRTRLAGHRILAKPNLVCGVAAAISNCRVRLHRGSASGRLKYCAAHDCESAVAIRGSVWVRPGMCRIAGVAGPSHPWLMRTLLNIIWFVFSGFWLWVAYMLAGVICCVLIITIPWGIASFRMASYAAWPFGREVVDKPTAGIMSVLGNVIWILAVGWWLVLTHIATGIALCLTIIGIPMGFANFKLIPVSLMPLGRRIVRTNV